MGTNLNLIDLFVVQSLAAWKGPIAKVGFGRKPALYKARAESRLFDMALKLSKMV